MKPYYYVFYFGLKNQYSSLSEAVQEAERLATKYPGEPFEVLQVVGISRVNKPAITFYVDGVNPTDEEHD